MEETTLSVDEQGTLVLPERLREKYGLQAGDVLALFDLDGMLVLLPRTSRVPGLARESLLVGLYDLGKISSGRAAEVLGISRREFLDLLGHYRVSEFDEEMDVEQERHHAAAARYLQYQPAD